MSQWWLGLRERAAWRAGLSGRHGAGLNGLPGLAVSANLVGYGG